MINFVIFPHWGRKGIDDVKKYRLCYDKYFLSNSPFEYKGEIIKGLDILFMYFIINKNRTPQTEIVLYCDKDREPHELFIEGKRINDFFDCYYDPKNFKKGYSIQATEFSKKCRFNICGMPLNCFKYTDDDIIQISHKELCSILYNNPQYFDNKFNRPTKNIYFKAVNYIPFFEQKTDHTFLNDENTPPYEIYNCGFAIDEPVIISDDPIVLIDDNGTIFQERMN